MGRPPVPRTSLVSGAIRSGESRRGPRALGCCERLGLAASRRRLARAAGSPGESSDFNGGAEHRRGKQRWRPRQRRQWRQQRWRRRQQRWRRGSAASQVPTRWRRARPVRCAPSAEALPRVHNEGGGAKGLGGGGPLPPPGRRRGGGSRKKRAARGGGGGSRRSGAAAARGVS